jgi:hypothetical protein
MLCPVSGKIKCDFGENERCHNSSYLPLEEGIGKGWEGMRWVSSILMKPTWSESNICIGPHIPFHILFPNHFLYSNAYTGQK